LIIFLLEQVFN